MVTFLLFLSSTIIFFLSYTLRKNVLEPSFVFCAVFVIASFNLLTNLNILQADITIESAMIIISGLIAFTIAGIVTGIKKVVLKNRGAIRKIYVVKTKLFLISVMNCVTIVYVLREVISITRKNGFTGTVFAALGRYAELSKFSSINVEISTLGTVLTALSEAAGYVLAYIIVYNFAHKIKNNKWLYISFLTAFISTFCQGSRGGLFMLLAALVYYLMVLNDVRGRVYIRPRLLFRALVAICAMLLLFLLSGVISGKMWDVSFYEYLSVYLGFPIMNFSSWMESGVTRTAIIGQASFSGLYSRIFGSNLPSFSGYGGFRYMNGHNMGNVYTIFASLVADFGIIGSTVACFFIGLVLNLLYWSASKKTDGIPMSRILYGYFLTGVAFSFFSNKVCENINVYHFFVFFFEFLFTMYLTQKKHLVENRQSVC